MEVLTNDTRVFRVDGDPEYLDGLGVWRIMWNGSDRRVILKGCGDSYRWLHDFPNGCTLELVKTEYGPVKEYEKGRVLYRFQNCHERRRWIPRPTALSNDELMRLDAWIEISCDVNFLFESNQKKKMICANILATFLLGRI